MTYRWPQRIPPLNLFLRLISGYVLLQTLATATSSTLFKFVSYGSAIGIALAMPILSLDKRVVRSIPLSVVLSIALIIYGCAGSALWNRADVDFASTLKFALLPLFVLVGFACQRVSIEIQWPSSEFKLALLLLTGLPLSLWIWQIYSGQNALGSSGSASIFANRNNAGLYAISIVALYNALHTNPLKSYVAYLTIGISFGTLGVLSAIILSLLLALGSWINAIGIVFASTVCVFAILALNVEIGVLGRIRTVLETAYLISSGAIDIRTSSYASLVEILGTTDLSFVFRLKHWADLLAQYTSASWHTILMGFGSGASTRMSAAGLVPHNDYLRILVEFGVVSFFGFTMLIGTIIYHCKRGWISVPVYVICLYFFSENLLDNFSAISLFFFSSGYILSKTNPRTRPPVKAMESNITLR